MASNGTVARRAAKAFVERRKGVFSSNTRTDGNTLYLFGKPIAFWDANTGIPYVCFAGRASRTTVGRIQAVCEELGRHDMRFSMACNKHTDYVPTLYVNGVEHDRFAPIAVLGPLATIAVKRAQTHTDV